MAAGDDAVVHVGERWARIVRDDGNEETLLRKEPQQGTPGCTRTFYKSAIITGYTVMAGKEVSNDGTVWVWVTAGTKKGYVNKKYVQFEPDDDEAQEDGEYEIERIMDEKVVGRGAKRVLKYLVSWVGWKDQPTWEPAENLEGVPKFEEYLEAKANVPAAKGKRKKRAKPAAKSAKRKTTADPVDPTADGAVEKLVSEDEEEDGEDEEEDGEGESENDEAFADEEGGDLDL